MAARSNLLLFLASLAITAATGALGPLCVLAQTIDTQPANLRQGWTSDQRIAWYNSTQGSRLIPLSWLQALEQAGNTNFFLRPDYIASFGYLIRSNRVGDLPIGFSVDRGPDTDLVRTRLRWMAKQSSTERWVGLNCSACHTTQLTYKGSNIRIDGGPSLSNFQKFVEALNASLVDTRSDPDKWARFAKRVLPKASERKSNEPLLRDAFEKLVAWQENEAKVNSTSLAYGPGRVDAFGHILNKIGLTLDASFAGNPSDAPVSIPSIWLAPQYDHVQYNGIAPSIPVPGTGVDVGALARNTGEMIGVFGDLVANSDPGVSNGFSSSLKTTNMMRLEELLKKLRPPMWPTAVFGKLNPRMAERGGKLFELHCSSCHASVDRVSVSKIETQMSRFDGMQKDTTTKERIPAPGTDPWMACNTHSYKVNAGILKGYKSLLLTKSKKIGSNPSAADMLTLSVVAALLDKKLEITAETARRLIGFDESPTPESLKPSSIIPENPNRSASKKAQVAGCYTDAGGYLGYTSRPLNGIWATAPYLHNGSVPTIYDLLLPEKERPTDFYLGSREYDPIKLGFAEPTDDQKPKLFNFKAFEGKNYPIDGNWNLGHDYNNGQFSETDRYAIIEYLKSI